jgi:hypothetical protein
LIYGDIWKELQAFLRQEAETVFPQDERGVFADFNRCPWGRDKVLGAAVKRFHSDFQEPCYDRKHRQAFHFLQRYGSTLHSCIYSLYHIVTLPSPTLSSDISM